MLRHRQVPELQTLCFQAVGKMVVSLMPHLLTKQLLSEPQKSIVKLQMKLEYIKQLLISHVPYYLYDTVAVEVLHAIKALIEKTKKIYYPHISMASFLTEMNVVVSLTEVVLSHQLKRIDFSNWPKMMRYVMYKNLVKLTGIEVLNLGSCTVGWCTSEHKYISEGIAGMSNLRSLCLCFDCTDCTIQIIGDNCPHLQCLDVTSSRSVTDRSVPSLLKCKQLKELLLHCTSVTVEGFAELLIGLEKLQDLGRCDEIGRVISYLHKNYPKCGPFGLKKLQTRDMTTENLRIFVDMCPKVEFVSLFHDEHMSDLTILTSLDNLKELKILSCTFYGDFLMQLLEVRGYNITSLHLEHVAELDMNALKYISQFCPYLKSLVLYNCDFVDHSVVRDTWLKVKPFQNLERLFWMVDCAVNHLEFLLIHAVNIKNIHLGSSTGITHSTIVNVLSTNPMKHLEELRILYSSDMSLRTVELLLASCNQLRVLSELESWQAITTEELETFRKHINTNNFDLDIRPTLSYC